MASRAGQKTLYSSIHLTNAYYLDGFKMVVVIGLTILVLSVLPMVPFFSGPDIDIWMICPSPKLSGVSDLVPLLLLRLVSVACTPTFFSALGVVKYPQDKIITGEKHDDI